MMNNKCLMVLCFLLAIQLNAWSQERIIDKDYKYVYILNNLEKQIGGYAVTEYDVCLGDVMDDRVLFIITGVKGTPMNVRMSLMSGNDTLSLMTNTLGGVKISRSELIKYDRYYIPAITPKYEAMYGTLLIESHSPLDWNVSLRITKIHILMKAWDVPTDYYLYSKIKLTDKQIDDFRKDITYDTKISTLYDSVQIYSAVRL